MEQITHFSRGVWVSDTTFHCPEFEVDLKAIDKVCTDLRVDRAVAALMTFLASVVLCSVVYFTCNPWWVACMIVMVGSFAWLRYSLFNYVELLIKVNGCMKKVMVVGMSQRKSAYEVEDYLKRFLA